MLLDLKSPHIVSIDYPKNSLRITTLLSAWRNNSKLPNGDFSVVLNIDDVIVGIRTMGDTIGSVWDSVVFFENHNCDIGVLACHADHLKRSGNCLTNGWKTEKINKVKNIDPTSIDQENRNVAENLFDKVMDAINQVKQTQ